MRFASVNLFPLNIHEQNQPRNCSDNMLPGSNVAVILYYLGFDIFLLLHAMNFIMLHPAKVQCFNLMLQSEVFMNSSNCTIYCTA